MAHRSKAASRATWSLIRVLDLLRPRGSRLPRLRAETARRARCLEVIEIALGGKLQLLAGNCLPALRRDLNGSRAIGGPKLLRRVDYTSRLYRVESSFAVAIAACLGIVVISTVAWVATLTVQAPDFLTVKRWRTIWHVIPSNLPRRDRPDGRRHRGSSSHAPLGACESFVLLKHRKNFQSMSRRCLGHGWLSRRRVRR